MTKRPYPILLLVVVIALLAFAGPAVADPGTSVCYATCGTSHEMVIHVVYWDMYSHSLLVDNVQARFTDGAQSSTVYFRFQNDNDAWTTAHGPDFVNGTMRTVWNPNREVIRKALQVRWGNNAWETCGTWQ